ncbi:type IV pilus twitching motility protein PilT [Pseudomonas alabamensis]|uniref:type IV pilus twitching motility protein PilT n=1 Tax=Pseudomonas alabamensis TaxID=3064349 RepID=UPI003F64FB03
MDVTVLVAQAVAAGACDLHLAAGHPPCVRVDGDLRRLELPPSTEAQVFDSLSLWLQDSQRTQWREGDELDLALTLPDAQRVRVNLFRQRQGLAVSLRLLPAQAPSLEALGLTNVFRPVSQWQDGLLLVAGPTGSGKSSTLAALVDHLNRERPAHVITLEDPIEIVHHSQRSLVTQREVGRHTRDFAQALRSALRQDPDVILLGELRDLESIRLALRAAQTGHLVLATVHARCAVSSIDHLVDVFDAQEKTLIRSLLAESLRMVVVQRLVKRRGGGRVAAREVLVATAAVRNLIREGRLAQLQSVMQTGAGQGMQTLEDALRALQAQGLIEAQDT